MLRRAGLKRDIRREPDHVLRTDIRTLHGAVNNVLCRVYLPHSVMDRPYLHFQPTQDQLKALTVPEFSVKGKTKWQDGSVVIKAGTVFTEGWEQKDLSPDIVECSLPGEPWDLEIVRSRTAESTETAIARGVFWITPNPLLSPALIRTASYTGDVTVKTAREISFDLSVLKVNFRKYFRHRTTSQGSLASSELVAQFEGPLERGSFNEVVEELDDLLLISSLASRQKCLCRGWRTYTNHTETLTYRSRFAAPSLRRIGQQETLIDRQEFSQFLAQGYKALRGSSARERLRQAVNLLLGADDGDLVTAFLKTFAALETVITFYRESAGLITILGPDEWNWFETDFRNFIKQHPLFKNDKSRRRLVYEKQSELNRIAFSTAFAEAVSTLTKEGLRVDDLWPVTGSSRGLSLAEIRNRMVHGVVFTPTQEHGLFAAKIHLSWCVERLLLAFLGWPVEKSLVGNFLRHMTAYNDWKEAQQLLSN
jgi:hypothetical protein